MIFRPSRQERLILLLLLLLHGLFFFFALIWKGIYTPDSPEYLWLGENILKGHFYSADPNLPVDPKFYSLRPPIYGFFISVFYAFWQNPFLVLLAQNVLSIFLFFHLFKWWGRFGFKNRGWILAAGLLLFLPQLILTNMIMADFLLGFWLYFGGYFLFQFLEKKQLKWFWLFQLMLVLALFTKPILLFFWLPNLLLSFWIFIQVKKNVQIIAAALLMPLFILLYSYWNNERTDYWHFSSLKSTNLIDQNARALLQHEHGYHYADSVVSEVLAKGDAMPNLQERSDYFEGEAKAIFFDAPLTYVFLHLKGSLNFFLDPGRTDLVYFFPYDPPEFSLTGTVNEHGLNGVGIYFSKVPVAVMVYQFIGLLWNLLLIVSLGYFLFKKRVPLIFRVFVVVLLLYAAGVSGAFSYARFKVGFYPLMLLAVGFFLQKIRRIN